ncbi:TlpA family protein disulfide reductase [Bradyrhizobium sp. SRL28]|uniref:TlpA disulfide reductase family protein n=1 Tax=Bradyrhizobium sp. SRL28 TaxID=2836178 RepID=UPI001BDF3778|nr:TlpA disulfide reductase family protein [Bradyrhizobium sp. SRL28]MBT1516377.1 TlpA family protein disulfide reductase [Bradyrhizobium sp. SRL28]
MVLRMESPAPPIKVENWLRGQPLTNLQSGKVYIVEFWATWCGSCVAAMPHLVQLQEKYKDSGLEVLGVAAHERARTADEVRTKLDAWLTEKFSNLNYRIGFDYTGEMNKLWMDASFSGEIPTSFVVDRDGHIAFIGRPTQLDDVLPKVLNGTWRTSEEAKAADIERIAEGERRTRETTRERALTKPIFAILAPAMKAEDWATALSAVEEAVAMMPDDINFRVLHADLLLHKMHDMRTGLPVLRQLVRNAIDKKSEVWMAGAMRQLFDPTNDNSYFPPAERLAMGKELSEHILALNPPHRGDGPKFLSYGALAQYYYESGNKDRAIELIELALKSLDGPEPIPDELKQHVLSLLLQALANYKGEKVCYGAFCAAPENKSPKLSKRSRRRRKREKG